MVGCTCVGLVDVLLLVVPGVGVVGFTVLTVLNVDLFHVIE